MNINLLKSRFSCMLPAFPVPSHIQNSVQWPFVCYLIPKMTSHLPITQCIVILCANFTVHLIPSPIPWIWNLCIPQNCGCNHRHWYFLLVFFSLMPPGISKAIRFVVQYQEYIHIDEYRGHTNKRSVRSHTIHQTATRRKSNHMVWGLMLR